MINEEELIEIIKSYGGEAGISEICDKVTSSEEFITEDDKRSKIGECLSNNPIYFYVNRETKKWALVKRQNISKKGKSELREKVTREVFEKVFKDFLKIADENAELKKSTGKQNPLSEYGIGNKLDGAFFTRHFGMGKASFTQYVCWHVVSVYYLSNSSNKKFVLGIENSRYRYTRSMKPIKYELIGNKHDTVAVFYETTRNSIDYDELYEKFIDVSEEVMEIGLE